MQQYLCSSHIQYLLNGNHEGFLIGLCNKKLCTLEFGTRETSGETSPNCRTMHSHTLPEHSSAAFCWQFIPQQTSNIVASEIDWKFPGPIKTWLLSWKLSVGLFITASQACRAGIMTITEGKWYYRSAADLAKVRNPDRRGEARPGEKMRGEKKIVCLCCILCFSVTSA